MKKNRVVALLICLLLILTSCDLLSKPSLDKAYDLIDEEEYDKAVDMIETLLEKDDENFDLYFGLVEAYMGDENYRKVDKTLSEIADLIVDNYDPDDKEIKSAKKDLLDLVKALEKEEETIGSWFADFSNSEAMSGEVVVNDDPEIVDDPDPNDSPNIDPNNGNINLPNNPTVFDPTKIDAKSLILLTYKEILDQFGEPNTRDEGYNTVELMYDSQPYTFLFNKDDMADQSKPTLISVIASNGYIDFNVPVIGLSYDQFINSDQAPINFEYFETSFLAEGEPILKYSDGSHYYIMTFDAQNKISECFIEVGIPGRDSSLYYAQDHLGMTLKQLESIYGTSYYVDGFEGTWYILYFGLPYYFMFDASLDFNDNSIVNIVMVDNGGYAFYDDTLSTITEDNFINSAGTKYTIIKHNELDHSVSFEALGYKGKILFGTSGSSNTVFAVNDLDLLGIEDSGMTDSYVPSVGLDFVGLTLAEIEDVYGSGYTIDTAGTYYQYIDYPSTNEYPFAFGFDVNTTLTQDSVCIAVFLYFDQGAAFMNGFTYGDITIDDFKSQEAQYYYSVTYNDDGSIYFEDDYNWYTLFYYDTYPTYLLIEMK